MNFKKQDFLELHPEEFRRLMDANMVSVHVVLSPSSWRALAIKR